MSERAEDQQAPADVTRALLRVAQYYDERDQDGTPVFPGASDVVPDYPCNNCPSTKS